MSLEETIARTAELLGVDLSEIDYITEESLAEAAKNGKKESHDCGDADGVEGADRWGVYCHNIQYPAGKDYIEYQRGPKGTPNYGCGKDWYTCPKTTCRVLKPTGRKCGSYPEYLASS